MQKAFTLIELLVVVLIIGILSAIALAQYGRAVDKAKGAEALLEMSAVIGAAQRYYLANGSYEGISAEALDISIPAMKHWQIGCAAGRGTKLVWVLNNGTGAGIALSNLSDANIILNVTISKDVVTRKECRDESATTKHCKDFFPCVGDVMGNSQFSSETMSTVTPVWGCTID